MSSELHQAVMNIPCPEDAPAVYKLGHREARRAAAEMVALAEGGPLLQWVAVTNGQQWTLLKRCSGVPTTVAHVWFRSDRYVWHTFDPASGVGGENDTSDTLEQAQALAAHCAIRQGFV